MVFLRFGLLIRNVPLPTYWALYSLSSGKVRNLLFSIPGIFHIVPQQPEAAGFTGAGGPEPSSLGILMNGPVHDQGIGEVAGLPASAASKPLVL